MSHHASQLFSPIQLAGVTFPNRVFVSPMCQYSSEDGFSNDWHLVHLGSRAVGGAGLVLARELLRQPYWPLNAAHELGDVASWPPQYLRAAPSGSTEREPIVSSSIPETAVLETPAVSVRARELSV